MSEGYLVVTVSSDTIAQPIEGASVKLYNDNEEYDYITNEIGQINPVVLKTVDKLYSTDPESNVKPYTLYNIIVEKEGFTTKIIRNIEIFPDVTSFSNVILTSIDEKQIKEEEIIIEPITLGSNYSPKINDKEINTNKKVLTKTIVPEYIIVHDGDPTNYNAKNYYVPFTDYIKNVGSSEIYSTWPKETIKANIAAIISFTLNRIYTEWYKSKGYNFTITSSTAYDQKYIHDRTIFSTIAEVVDEMFLTYINIDGKEGPFLAQYNDGINVNNDGWLSQWGSYELGKQGYSYDKILKYYYGNNINLLQADEAFGYPASYPGNNLKLGSCGEEVQKVQNQLNYIHNSYPLIPIIENTNGIFDPDTKKSVEIFQKTFYLKINGIVDLGTWYKISYIYTAVKGLAQGITN